MSQIRVGDLCSPDNVLKKRGTILVSDRDLLKVLFDVDAEALLMVTTEEEITPRISRNISSICDSMRQRRPADTKLHQVIVASGKHTGRVGYVPSFWLRTVVSAR
jgi:hypothetical protein